jgi:anthranilate phosphoribosyltransferase
LRSVLNGEKGAKRDAAVLNAAAAMYISGKYDTIQNAIRIAEEIIESGKAMNKLDEFIRCSNEGEGCN